MVSSTAKACARAALIFCILIGLLTACATSRGGSSLEGSKSETSDVDSNSDSTLDENVKFDTNGNVISEVFARQRYVSVPSKWFVSSAIVRYVDGSIGSIEGFHQMELYADTWVYEGNYSEWEVEFITDSDWEKWGIEEGLAERKIVLQDWIGGAADGPIDEEEGRMKMFTIIYRTVDSGKAGQVQLRFERQE